MAAHKGSNFIGRGWIKKPLSSTLALNAQPLNLLLWVGLALSQHSLAIMLVSLLGFMCPTGEFALPRTLLVLPPCRLVNIQERMNCAGIFNKENGKAKAG